MDKLLEVLAEVNVMTVSEFIEKLSGEPPMMVMFGYDGDNQEMKFINSIDVKEDNGVPCLIITFNSHPYIRRDLESSHEERVDKQREYARQLTVNSQQALDMPENVE